MNTKAKVDYCCFGKTFNGILFLTDVFYCKFFHTKKLMFLLKFHILLMITRPSKYQHEGPFRCMKPYCEPRVIIIASPGVYDCEPLHLVVEF